MEAMCEYANAERRGQRSAYTVLCPGELPDTVDNYLLVEVDGIGFVVIRQVIDVD